MKYRLSIWVFFLLLCAFLQAQDRLEFRQFFHPNGLVSSEGYMRKGQPDGIWKSYDEQGRLVSEGARENLELQGIWKFYKEGEIISQIAYEKGKKEGLSVSYEPKQNKRTEEFYKRNQLEGKRRTYVDSIVIKETPYIKGQAEGLDKEYNTQGDLIYVTLYRKGFIVSRERINRRDKQNRKQGVWKAFYPTDQLYWELPYVDNTKHGYYKEYDTTGNIIKIEKYEFGVLQEEAPELAKMEVRTEYYANGAIKLMVPVKNGKPEGLCRVYDSISEKVVKGIFFKAGKQIGTGIVDENGMLQDNWKEYYPDGKLKCEGMYKRGKRNGAWQYYYDNGTLQQEGEYLNGKLEGAWLWYYPDGRLRLEQNYMDGSLEGLSVEYDEKGIQIAKGSYVDGQENGKWEYRERDERLIGNYKNGNRQGEWRSYWNSSGKKLSFKGSYSNDLPNGKHFYFWDNGQLREEAIYSNGKRIGVWKKFDEKGELEVRIIHDKNEEEIRYD